MQECVEIPRKKTPFRRVYYEERNLNDTIVEITPCDDIDPKTIKKATVDGMLGVEKLTTRPKPKRKRQSRRKGKPKARQCKHKLSPEQKKEKRLSRILYLQKLNSSMEVIVDRLLGFPRITLVNVILNVPEIDVVLQKAWVNGDNLTGRERYLIKAAENGNAVMERFDKALRNILDKENARRKAEGVQAYPHGMFKIWVREFGQSLGRRHYHVTIGINTKVVYSVGRYNGLPCLAGNFVQKIAWAWLEAIGLDRLEDNRPGNASFKNPYMGDLIYYPGKKVAGKDKEGKQKEWIAGKEKPYKSRVVSRQLTHDDFIWLDYWISYMLKPETKTIPENRQETTNERESVFGRSQLIFTNLTEEERKMKRRELNKGRKRKVSFTKPKQ